MSTAAVTRKSWIRRATWILLALAGSARTAFAANTHHTGGVVTEAAAVPETDNRATVQVYWNGDTSQRTSVPVGATLAGYWLQDAGFNLPHDWRVGDTYEAVVEMETGAGTSAHTGYYGIVTKSLTSLDPDELPAVTVQMIPSPVATAGDGFVDLSWAAAVTSGGANGVAGYNVYRSTDGITFTQVNSTMVAGTSYRDTSALWGVSSQYALQIVYAGTPGYNGASLSKNSA